MATTTTASSHNSVARLINNNKARFSSPNAIAKQSQVHFSNNKYHQELGSLSMNGCRGDPRAPVGTVETRAFPAAPTVEVAADRLGSAVYELKSSPPRQDSGIIRIEVPIQQQIESLDWLRSQNHGGRIPRSYFSGREPSSVAGVNRGLNGQAGADGKQKLVSVAGLGSAVFFRDEDPFSMNDWHSIKRFLSKDSPLVRAYGAIRFDGKSEISSEWKDFGGFYFAVPQIEFDEFEGGSMLAATIAWDKKLSKTYEQAIAALEATLWQLSSVVRKVNQKENDAILLHKNHVPNRESWESMINQALQMINDRYSSLVKVVHARSTRVLTSSDIDPLDWLNTLQVEGGHNSFQFCVQPPQASAFIGNTPERLFYRDGLTVFSEALAATRARGQTEALDLQIGHDLLTSPKDDHEFGVVRETIRKNFEAACTSTKVHPTKSLRKLKRVQHLYAKLTGTLEREDDEFKILSSLHPTPAVCGLPAEDARVLISDSEMFDRGMYAGPVGWFGGAESEFAVGIRSALVGKGGAVLYAGTGIVDGSIPASEWQELELKISQFTKLMKAEETVVAARETIGL